MKTEANNESPAAETEAISEDKATPRSRDWYISDGLIIRDADDNEVATVPLSLHDNVPAKERAELIVGAVNNAALFEEVKAENVRLRDEIVTWKQRAERCPYCGNYSLTIDVYNTEDGLEERCQTATCVSFGEDISIYARRLQKRFEEVVEALEAQICSLCGNRIGFTGTAAKYASWQTCQSCATARAALAKVEETKK